MIDKMDKDTMDLLIKADSLLSYFHHRGYIDYTKKGCPDQNEVINLYGAIRAKYETYAKENGISLAR